MPLVIFMASGVDTHTHAYHMYVNDFIKTGVHQPQLACAWFNNLLNIIFTNVRFVYVIAWVAVKFGINTTSVVLEMGKISRGKAE